MGSEYPNIKLNNKLVEIDEEEQESLRGSINKRANVNDIELESANTKEAVIHILLKSLLSEDDTQDLVQGKIFYKLNFLIFYCTVTENPSSSYFAWTKKLFCLKWGKILK